MGILRRLAGFLGIAKEETHEANDAGGGRDEKVQEEEQAGKAAPRGPTKGFSVQVPVAVERPSLGPVLIPCSLGEGGVQGFRWYTRRLRIDEDGDVADEFLDENMPENSGAGNQIAPPRFQVKYNTRPTALAMRKQVVAADGNIHQSLEYRGRLRWV